MRKIQIVFMLLLGFGLVSELKSQNFQKSNLEQGFEYYFATAQYDKAIKALEILYNRYDLHSVKLNFALDVAIKFNYF